MSAVFRTARLKCIAGRGMFPHEASILIHGAEMYYESMVDRELVSPSSGNAIGDKDVPATVTVGVVKSSGDRLLVELPRQVVSGGRRIWVLGSEVDAYGPSVPIRNR